MVLRPQNHHEVQAAWPYIVASAYSRQDSMCKDMWVDFLFKYMYVYIEFKYFLQKVNPNSFSQPKVFL